MSGQEEQKAIQLMQDANKRLNSPAGFLSKLLGGPHSTRLEEASDLYVRAANSFKIAKKWSAAGSAFCDSASCQLKMDSRHNAAQNYVSAATCYRKSDYHEAIKCLNKATNIFTDMGRFSIAAKHHATIAEIYECDLKDFSQAVSNYQKAADFHQGEHSRAAANKCLLKVAQYSAQTEDYERAIEIYEKVASEAVDSRLLKYGAKEHYFKAAICHMCVDMLNGQHAVNRYEELFPAFIDSRECKFLKNLILALEEENVESFTEVVKAYDKISRLDPWTTTMLLRVKRTISDEPDLR